MIHQEHHYFRYYMLTALLDDEYYRLLSNHDRVLHQKVLDLIERHWLIYIDECEDVGFDKHTIEYHWLESFIEEGHVEEQFELNQLIKLYYGD